MVHPSRSALVLWFKLAFMKIFFKLLFLLWLFLPAALNGQNLVLNPGFEEYEACPTLVNVYLDLTIVDWDETASSDYFNMCSNTSSLSPPMTMMGFQYPKEGEAYTGIIVYNSSNTDQLSREYMIGRLSSPLEKDSFYEVHISVSFAEHSLFACNGIQVLLSKEYPPMNDPPAHLIHAKPQLSAPEVLTDTAEWTELCWIYQAEGGESFITLGNFMKSEDMDIVVDPWGAGVKILSYYFLDDISVEKVPSAVFATALGDEVHLCESELPDTLAAAGAYETFLWNTGDTTSWLAIWESGEYILEAQKGGCLFYDTVVYEVVPTLSLDLPEDTLLCRDDTLWLSAGEGFDVYAWSTGDTLSVTKIVEEGSYWVEAGYFCDTLEQGVEVAYAPDLFVSLPSEVLVYLGDSVYVEAEASNPVASYSWQPAEGLSCAVCGGQWVAPMEDGHYVLEVEDVYGCVESAELSVLVQNRQRVYVPTAFSPNGDGINDAFVIYGGPEVELIYDLQVYDRWGSLLYRQDTGSPLWDGRAGDGQWVAPGVYLYVFSVRYLNGRTEVFSGDVVVFR